ncbi:MAG: peptidylprolyl isomerase [Bacilli bacterium]|nr:peptidylprolyl isomerase [Bacilli bacterium]
MKKKLFLLISAGLLLTGCGEIPKTKDGKDALITFEDGKKISVDEVYEKMKDSYALQTIIPMIDQYVLESEFPDEIENAKEKASSTIKAYKEQFGGEETLLQMVQQYGYADIEAFEKTMYVSNLENFAVEEYAKTLVKDKEIEKYYKDNVYGDVKVKHILITPEVTDELSEDEIKKAEDKAKKQIEDIIAELQKAKDPEKKFEELAKKHSQDDDTKEKGGDLGYINYGTLSSAYDELVDSALNLKNGKFSTKVITTELGYHVIYRVSQKEKAELKEVKDDIITTLSEEKLKEDSTISGQALQYYRKKYGLKITDDEVQKQYANYVQSTLTPATEENEEK